MLIPKADRKLIHELVLPLPPLQRMSTPLDFRNLEDWHFDMELLRAPSHTLQLKNTC